jgi:hypothetical protein
LECRLLAPDKTPLRGASLEFLLHGFKYVFPPRYRPRTIRGIPTAHAAPVAANRFGDAALPPVWPSPAGTARGLGVEPLYPSVAAIAVSDCAMYDRLALLDMLRMGRARETAWAASQLEERLK